MKSIFLNKDLKPSIEDLKKKLGETFHYWRNLEDFTKENYPGASTEWNFSSPKYGWSYRISDNKRVLVYLLPRDKFFKIAFVFGQKATDKILESAISETIKSELNAAKKYAEGKGIRIEVKDSSIIEDLHELIKVKIG